MAAPAQRTDHSGRQFDVGYGSLHRLHRSDTYLNILAEIIQNVFPLQAFRHKARLQHLPQRRRIFYSLFRYDGISARIDFPAVEKDAIVFYPKILIYEYPVSPEDKVE